MALPLPADIVALIDDPDTTKVLATVDGDGVPHAVVKNSLHVGEDGNLHVLELLESSSTNRNLIRSLWFDRTVAVSLNGRDGRTVQIKGRPIKTLITGPLFQQHYRRLRERLGDVDLAGVWIIRPEQVSEQTLEHRQAEEARRRPTFLHLDRILRA